MKENSTPFIPFPPNIEGGFFVKREKRFLAHVILADGSRAIAHCPNTGSMRSCLLEGAPVLLARSDNPSRKYNLSWLAIQINGTWIGIDTILPNKLAKLAVAEGFIEPLGLFDCVESEKFIAPGSRIDLVASSAVAKKCYIEVKNVTLVEGETARFPDAVTERGRKHLLELERKVAEGERAAMIYLVQRGDAARFRPADDIDPAYGEALRRAAKTGVEVYALLCEVSPEGVRAKGLLPVDLGG